MSYSVAVKPNFSDQLTNFCINEVGPRASNLAILPCRLLLNTIAFTGVPLLSVADWLTLGKFESIENISVDMYCDSNIFGELFMSILTTINPNAKTNEDDRYLAHILPKFTKFDSRVKSLAAIPVMVLARTVSAVVSPIFVIPAILTCGKYSALNTYAFESLSTTFIVYEVHRFARHVILGV